MNIPAQLLKPALAKISENLSDMIRDSYVDGTGKPLQLEEGESDFCTLFYQTDGANKGSRLKCIICSMDSTGAIKRYGIGQYDFQQNVDRKLLKK